MVNDVKKVIQNKERITEEEALLSMAGQRSHVSEKGTFEQSP